MVGKDYFSQLKHRLPLMFLLFLLGCSSIVQSPPVSAVKIIGGTIVTPDGPGYSNVVGLSVNRPPHAKYTCSGSIIAPHTILTAGHCYAASTIIFHKEGSDAAPLYVPVTKHVLSKRYWNFIKGNDIAFLQFDGDLPDGFAPATILANEQLLQSGTTLKTVGYGITATGGSIDGHLRTVDLTINWYANSPHNRAEIRTGPTPGRNTCEGDSGGPAYLNVNNQWLVAGVTSGRPVKLGCEAGVAIFVYAGAFKQWVAQNSGENLSGDAGPSPLIENYATVWPSHHNFVDWCQDETVPKDGFTIIDDILTLTGVDPFACVQAENKLKILPGYSQLPVNNLDDLKNLDTFVQNNLAPAAPAGDGDSQ